MASSFQAGLRTRASSANRGILRAVLTVSAAGVAVKLAALLKEIVVAGVYGRSDAMDAFLAAALIPGLLVNLIAESMNQALVPTLIRVREREGREPAQQLLSSAMLWMCVLLVGATIAMAFGARAIFPLIASHFSPPKLALSIHLFYALLPVVLITGIAANCTAVLNTVERFTLPALAPGAISIVIIAVVLTLGARLGIWAVVYGTLAGSLVQTLIVASAMQARGYRLRLWWHGSNEAAREVAGQYGPVLLSGLVASGGLLVDQAMAAMLPAGSVSALVYGYRFVAVALTLLAGSISTAVVPYFSQLIAHRDWLGCRITLRTWLARTALASVPVCALLVAIAHPLVRLAFQHGVFGPQDTAIVARVLAMFAIQIPFYVTSRVFYRFLVSMRRTDLALWCGIVNLALDVALNLILMRSMGVAGIALATSLWTVSTFLFLGYWARRVLRNAEAEIAR